MGSVFRFGPGSNSLLGCRVSGHGVPAGAGQAFHPLKAFYIAVFHVNLSVVESGCAFTDGMKMRPCGCGERYDT